MCPWHRYPIRVRAHVLNGEGGTGACYLAYVLNPSCVVPQMQATRLTNPGSFIILYASVVMLIKILLMHGDALEFGMIKIKIQGHSGESF